MARRFLSVPIGAAAILAIGSTAVAYAAPAIPAQPASLVDAAVPPRTSMAVATIVPGASVGTANDHEARPALSIVKLYLVDYAIRHGDGSADDRALCERAIRFSDDSAAQALDAKYPQAIDATAAEYHLTDTRRGAFWGVSYTSAADVAQFLVDKQTQDPSSPIFGWMSTAGATAADGTAQNWGTSHIPGVIGTKWGWSDQGPTTVASASFGPGFAVVTQTYGTPDDETADIANIPSRLFAAIVP